MIAGRGNRRLLCVCHKEEVKQDKFYTKGNGKLRPLSDEEFSKLRTAEIRRRNFENIPYVVFRWVCPVTEEIGIATELEAAEIEAITKEG